MTDPLGRLEAIAERWKRATPGPWYANVNDLIGGTMVGNRDKPSSQYDNRRESDSGDRGIANFIFGPDAEAIAHAPNDIAYLLERLGEAEALLDEWHGGFTANAEMRTSEWLANVIARTSAFLSEHP